MISEDAFLKVEGKGKNRRNRYAIHLENISSLSIGNIMGTHGKKRLHFISDTAMASLEDFIDELHIAVGNPSEDAAVERIFEKFSLFKGESGEVALILEPCTKPFLRGLWKIFVEDPDNVSKELDIPFEAERPGISSYPITPEKNVFF